MFAFVISVFSWILILRHDSRALNVLIYDFHGIWFSEQHQICWIHYSEGKLFCDTISLIHSHVGELTKNRRYSIATFFRASNKSIKLVLNYCSVCFNTLAFGRRIWSKVLNSNNSAISIITEHHWSTLKSNICLFKISLNATFNIVYVSCHLLDLVWVW